MRTPSVSAASDQGRRRGLPAEQDAVERVQRVGDLRVGARRLDEAAASCTGTSDV
jgi:hypothetical protein